MHVPRPNVDVHHQTSHPQRRLAEFVSSRSFRVSTATHHPGQREHHSPAAWDFTNSQNSQNSHFANRIASGPGLHEAVGWGCFGSILIKRRKILSGTSCTSHNSARSEGNKRNKETKGPRQAVMFADYLQTRTIYDYVLIRYWLFFICALEMPTTDPKVEHLDALCRDRAALRPEPLQCGTAKSSKNQWPRWFDVIRDVFDFSSSNAKSGLALRANYGPCLIASVTEFPSSAAACGATFGHDLWHFFLTDPKMHSQGSPKSPGVELRPYAGVPSTTTLRLCCLLSQHSMIFWYSMHSRAPNAKFAFSNRDLKVLCKHHQKSLRSRPAATEGLWFWQFVEFSLEDMNMPSPEPTKTTSSKQILLSCRLSATRGTH